jgi:hypothetical protein
VARYGRIRNVFFLEHIHGPYELENWGEKLIVKEYLNLRRTRLWPADRLARAEEIRVYLYYKPEFHIKIDAR